MTPAESEVTSIERIRQAIGRAAFVCVVGGLATGALLFLAGLWGASSAVLSVTYGVLLALPIVNVMAVLAEEARRRDWGFAAAALAVLALLVYAVADRLAR